LPKELTRDAILKVTDKSNILGYSQMMLHTLSKIGTPEEAYYICWQSALCYASIGWIDKAYRYDNRSKHYKVMTGLFISKLVTINKIGDTICMQSSLKQQ
jgi:hypothetical protein